MVSIYVNGKQVPVGEAKHMFRMAAFRLGVGCEDTLHDIWASAIEDNDAEVAERWDPEEARDKVFEVSNYTMEIDVE